MRWSEAWRRIVRLERLTRITSHAAKIPIIRTTLMYVYSSLQPVTLHLSPGTFCVMYNRSEVHRVERGWVDLGTTVESCPSNQVTVTQTYKPKSLTGDSSHECDTLAGLSMLSSIKANNSCIERCKIRDVAVIRSFLLVGELKSGEAEPVLHNASRLLKSRSMQQ